METLCEACGAANPQGVDFCLFCGAYLEWTDRESVIDTQPGRVPADPAPADPAPPARTEVAFSIADEQPVVIPSLQTTRTAPATLTATPAPEPERVRQPPRQTGTRVASAEPGGTPCPACGRRNDAHLHFCSRCGQTLREEPPAPPASQTAAWRHMVEHRDRAARRAYRRSLPPLYRWRRVVLAVLVPLLLLGGGVAVGRHPVSWVKNRWWDLRGTTVAVTGLTATTSPAAASAPGSDPAWLVDGTEQAWSAPWNPRSEGDSCGGAPGTAMVVLTFPATRIREIDLSAGLSAADARRPLEFVPQAIGVRFDAGPCRRFTLPNDPALQRLEVDSQVAVTSITIGVDTTYPARSDGTRVLSITEIALRSRPAS